MPSEGSPYHARQQQQYKDAQRHRHATAHDLRLTIVRSIDQKCHHRCRCTRLHGTLLQRKFPQHPCLHPTRWSDAFAELSMPVRSALQGPGIECEHQVQAFSPRIRLKLSNDHTRMAPRSSRALSWCRPQPGPHHCTGAVPGEKLSLKHHDH